MLEGLRKPRSLITESAVPAVEPAREIAVPEEALCNVD